MLDCLTDPRSMILALTTTTATTFNKSNNKHNFSINSKITRTLVAQWICTCQRHRREKTLRFLLLRERWWPVRIYLYMNIKHGHLHTQKHTSTHMHTHAHAPTHTYTHTHAHTHTHACARIGHVSAVCIVIINAAWGPLQTYVTDTALCTREAVGFSWLRHH